MNNKELVREISKKFLQKTEERLRTCILKDNDSDPGMDFILTKYAASEENFDTAKKYVTTLLQAVKIKLSTEKSDYRKKVLEKYFNSNVQKILFETLNNDEFLDSSKLSNQEKKKIKKLIETSLKNTFQEIKAWLASDNRDFEKARAAVQKILNKISTSTAKHLSLPAIVYYLLKLLNRIIAMEYPKNVDPKKEHISNNLKKIIRNNEDLDSTQLEQEKEDSKAFIRGPEATDMFEDVVNYDRSHSSMMAHTPKVYTEINELATQCTNVKISDHKKEGNSIFTNMLKNLYNACSYYTNWDCETITGLYLGLTGLRSSIHDAESTLRKLKNKKFETITLEEIELVKNVLKRLEDIKKCTKGYINGKYDEKESFLKERRDLLEGILSFTDKYIKKYTKLLQDYDDSIKDS